MASSSNHVSTKMLADWVEFINERLEKLPIENVAEARSVAAALNALVSEWGAVMQSHTDTRVQTTAQVLLERIEEAFPKDLAQPMKRRILSIHEIIEESNLYVENPHHISRFQQTLFDRISKKIEELTGTDQESIAQRSTEREQGRIEAHTTRELMLSRKAPSPHDEASTLSEQQGHWADQFQQSLNEAAKLHGKPEFTCLEVAEILRALGHRTNDVYDKILFDLCKTFETQPDLFEDHANLISNWTLNIQVWPVIRAILASKNPPASQYPVNIAEVKAFLADPHNQELLSQVEELDLRNKHLMVLPPEIGYLSGLKTLYLGNNELQRLPAAIGNLTRLDMLDLSSNQLATLPGSLNHLTRLTCLQLLNNAFEVFPTETTLKVSLYAIWSRLYRQLGIDGEAFDAEQIKLYFNNPDNQDGLAQITHLDLSGLNMHQLPPELGRLTGLVDLNLEWNFLSTLPQEMEQLTRLQRLNIELNQFHEYPAVLSQLKSLEEVKVLGVHTFAWNMTEIKETIAINLIWKKIAEHLQIQGAHRNADEIQSYLSAPENEPVLRQIKILNLIDQDIDAVPEVLSRLTGLETLILKSTFMNRLEVALPPALVETVALNRMWKKISEQLELQGAPEGVDAIRAYMSNPENQALLGSIKELDLKWLGLKILPKEIRYLSGLTKLNVEGNFLHSLPQEIEQLTSLTEFNKSLGNFIN